MTTPTPTPAPDPVPAAAVAAILDQMGWPDDRHTPAHTEPDGTVTIPAGTFWALAVDLATAAAPHVRDQTLRAAHSKLRAHASSYLGTETVARATAARRAQPDDERARRHAAIHRFYARGIEAAADDLAELLEDPPPC